MDNEAEDPPGLARIELEPGEERTLRQLAGAMGIVGVLQLIFYGILLLWGLFVLFGFAGGHGVPVTGMLTIALGLVYAALPLWQGVMLRETGEAIGRVGGADGEDQDFLASAFRRLRVVFVIELLLSLWELKDIFD